MSKNLCVIAASFLFLCSINLSAQNYNTAKPFSRWWWMGSAVSPDEITRHLTDFQKAGLGGVEITPIYGVKGQEDAFIPFLSDEYIDILKHTVHVADSLGLAVDMVLGTGWPYGGPHVTAADAASQLDYDTLWLDEGQKIDSFLLSSDARELVAIVAKPSGASNMKLPTEGDKNHLQWQANLPSKLYFFYSGKTKQKVKRAAPGGEGFTVDHFSKKALEAYVKPFDQKLPAGIRAIFNDSYEVYGTDFTPRFLDEFHKRRGYDLTPFLPWMVDKLDSEKANQIRCDYRETISDLLLESFNRPWTEWAHTKNYITRLQAHGSPGNLLDMYASADIPECETFGSMPFDIPGFRREMADIRAGDADRVMLKFSSSAAHMTGKSLVSSETFTWLRDHFKVALSQCKPEVEELLLSGINHLFLHGSTYSPGGAEWPGWKFYASTNFAPQMNIWHDAPALFDYIASCEAILQKGEADNEVAVYFPMHDIWTSYKDGKLCLQLSIHALKEWLLGTPFYETNQVLMNAGYGVDFFSDRFLETASVEDGKIHFGNSVYKAIVIPKVEHMPLKTLEKLLELRKQGAVIVFEDLPGGLPGFARVLNTLRQFEALVGQVGEAEEVLPRLKHSQILPEELGKTQLKFLRRKLEDSHVYYIVNHTSQDFDERIHLNSSGTRCVLYDPLHQMKGFVNPTQTNDGLELRLQLKAGESLFITTQSTEDVAAWIYYRPMKEAQIIDKAFELTFPEKSAISQKKRSLKKLVSWTELGEQETAFSGTATYEVRFKRPTIKQVDAWKLQLPDVRESARIYLNGQYVQTLWSNPFECVLPALKKKNVLKIEVSNLDANRIRAQEIDGKEWKIFYEINMVNKDYKTFDATRWQAMPSGIIGEVKLIPLKKE